MMVVTGDRDVFQLIEPGVRVMATSRGITDTKIYDREAVIDRYGIPPELIPDFYGLKGDTSDNIPGVPGHRRQDGRRSCSRSTGRPRGRAGATSTRSPAPSARRTCTEHADDARISKQLATAIRDIDVGRRPRPGRRARARPLAAARDVPRVRAARPAASASRRRSARTRRRRPRARTRWSVACEAAASRAPRTVARPRDLGEPRRRERPRPAGGRAGGARTRTSPARPGRSRLRARYAGGDEVLVGDAETLAALAMAWGERPVVAHDWKTIAVGRGRRARAAARARHDGRRVPDRPGAARLPARRAGRPRRASRRAVEGANGARPQRAVRSRALLAERQRDAARRGRADAASSTRSSCRSSTCWSRWSAPGVKLDVERLARDQRALRRARGRARAARSGSWPARSSRSARRSSSRQILFEKLGLSRKRRGKTGFSTDARVLQAIRDEHEIVPRDRGVARAHEAEVAPTSTRFPELIGADGRLHTTFNQTATTTGRLSSTNPNLQNIPIRTEQGREIRACFVAEEGYRLISADYSQVELRLLAHIADEPVLKEIFERGEDVHTATAEAILGPAKTDPGTRSKAKMVNFGIVYGLSRLRPGRPAPDPARGGAASSSTPTSSASRRCRQFIEQHDRAGAPTEGYVTTLFGRIRRDARAALAPVPDPPAGRAAGRQHGHPGHGRGHHQGRDGALRATSCATPACPRGSCCRSTTSCCSRAPRREVERATEIVEREMAGAFELDPPLEVDVGVGENWLEAK